MKYPQEFYYSIRQGMDFTTSNTGNIDIQRLLDGRSDYWVSPSPSLHWYPKNLILADWAFNDWLTLNKEEVAAVLESMQADGFSIFYYNHAKKLQAWDAKEVLSPINIPHTGKILADTQALKLSGDSILILDNNRIHALIHPEKNLPRPLFSLGDLSQKINKSPMFIQVMDLINQDFPEKPKIWVDLFSPDTQFILGYLSHHYSFPTFFDYQEIQFFQATEWTDFCNAKSPLSKENCLNVTRLCFKQKDQIDFSDLSGLQHDLQAVQEIFIESCEALISLNNLCKLTPQLKKLYINKLKSLNGTVFLKDELPALKHLEIVEVESFAQETLHQLLISAPNLETLTINNCSNWNLALAPNTLRQLQKLTLSGCCLSLLQNLLISAPELIEITVNTPDPHIAIEASLLKLKIFKITITNLSAENLSLLLKQTPNLEKLAITYEKCHGLMDLKDNSLPNLKNVSLDSAGFSQDNFLNLCRAARNISKLKIFNCSLFTENLILEDGILSELKDFSLEHADISEKNLRYLIQSSPKLVTIILNCILEYTPEAWIAHPESQLKVFSTYSTNGSLLKKLFFSVPSLEFFANQDDEDGMTVPNFEGLPESKLKVLKDEVLSVDLRQFHHLMAVIPQVNKLSIMVQDNGETSDISPIDLHALKCLQLNINFSSTRSAIFWQSFFSSTLNLENLELAFKYVDQHLDSLDDLPFDLKRKSLSQLTTLKLKNIDGETVLAFLLAAPQLEILTLDESWQESELFEYWPDICLTKLHTLIINNNKDAKDLSKLLTFFPRLEDLNINIGKSELKSLSLPINILPSLTKFCLNSLSQKISLDNLINLFQAAPKLECLSLFNTVIEWGDMDLSPNSLPKLKKLDLSYCQLNAEILGHFLIAAPSLVDIRVTSCKYIKGELLTEKISLDKLINFNFLNTTFDAFSLKCLLEKMPFIHTTIKENTLQKCSIKPNTERFIDADTQNKNHTYQLKSLFKRLKDDTRPNVSGYRQKIYDTAVINQAPCSIKRAFILKNIAPPVFHAIDPRQHLTAQSFQARMQELSANPNSFYSSQEIEITTHWTPLVSLSAHERLLDYYAPSKGKLCFVYSQETNLHYVKSEKSQTIRLDFLLEIPPLSHPELPDKIQQILRHISSWSSTPTKSLELKNSNPSGMDYLQAIIEQKIGACRHRIFAFKVLFSQDFPDMTPPRFVLNDCHAFVELKFGDYWYSFDLGGYAANMVVQELPAPPQDELDFIPSLDEMDALLADESTAKHDDLLDMSDVQGWSQLEETFHSGKVAASMLMLQQSLGLFATSSPLKVSDYLASCCSFNGKRLIECQSLSFKKDLIQALEDFALRINRPCFYVDQAQVLRCASPFIAEGQLHPGPGGPFYDFIQSQPNGLIIVDYDYFKPDEWVSFNSLLDSQAKADGVLLQATQTIMGLRSLSSVNTPGADFYSRFNLVETCPLNQEELSPWALNQITSILPAEAKIAVIDLYHAQDWKERLMGRWSPHAGYWVKDEGEWGRAMAEDSDCILIRNGLWSDPYFSHFIQRLQQEHKSKIIYQAEGYNWSLYQDHIIQLSDLPEDYQVINDKNYLNFMHMYEIGSDKNLYKNPGHLHQHSGSPMNLRVTHPLTQDAWAMIFDEALRHKVKLQIFLDPGVSFIEAFDWKNEATRAKAFSFRLPLPASTVLETSDPLASIRVLEKFYPNSILIDVSECAFSDIHSRILPKISGSKLEFEMQYSILKTALDEDRTVILYGGDKRGLSAQIAEFLLQREKTPDVKGRIFICPSDPKAYGYLRDYYEHQIKALGSDLPLALLEAKDRFHRLHSSLSWDAQANLSDEDLDPRVFLQGRLNLVMQVLNREPYVFLRGPSGSGKSTFVYEYLAHQSGIRLYAGWEGLKAWAEDKTSDLKILFFDEANLNPSEWTLFSGLYLQSPQIVFEGNIYPLDTKHKLIFAGNPKSYANGRKEASFFKDYDHHNQIQFNPLPKSVLADELGLSGLIRDTIFRIYDFCIKHEILITPREFKSMLLLNEIASKGDGAANFQFFAYHLGLNHIPKTLVMAYQNLFPSEILSLAHSRQNLRYILETYIKWHEEKHPNHGSLGGCILEGEPGQGKSHLLTELLESQSYRGITDLKQAISADEKIYCYLPAGMAQTQKEALLIQAFDLGLLVIIDEFNTTHLSETLLNALLMGHHQDGRPPRSPGFFILGTQNPSSMRGRSQLSPALERRLHILKLPSYSPQEMQEILQTSYGLAEEDAAPMIEAYLKLLAQTPENSDKLQPNFRNLVAMAMTSCASHSEEPAATSEERAYKRRCLG